MISAEDLREQAAISSELEHYFSTIVKERSTVRVSLSKPVVSEAILCHREYHRYYYSHFSCPVFANQFVRGSTALVSSSTLLSQCLCL
jgi:hypothetical protein